MTTTSTNLGLTLYRTITDASSTLIYDYIDQTSGSVATSNLQIIDTFAGQVSASITDISASLTTINADIARPRSAIIQVVEQATEVNSISGIFYLFAPSEINGLNLVRAKAFVNTSGSVGDITLQLRNLSKYPSNDMLSGSGLGIYVNTTVSSDPTIDTSYDDVETDNQIKIYVTSGSDTTNAKGLQVVTEWL